MNGFVDGAGVYGQYLHFAGVVFFVGTALLVFFYLWWNGRLDMDEHPKYQMMEEENSRERK